MGEKKKGVRKSSDVELFISMYFVSEILLEL